jgi:uncharacterized SAM-binding protein YcdF (DUF218 family)
MRSRRKKAGLKRTGVAIGLLVALLLLSVIPIKISIAFHQAPQPQAIFVLGGDFDRTTYAAEVWRSHPEMDVWVSDFPAYLEQQQQLLNQWGVPIRQIRLDGRATDTVTNFTTLVDRFGVQKLQHLFLVTSDSHMRRARAIAAIVLGSRGVVVTPLPMPSKVESESWVKVLRDGGRSVLWIVTGRTGASLNPALENSDRANGRRVENYGLEPAIAPY